jgi:hypothetical protein
MSIVRFVLSASPPRLYLHRNVVSLDSSSRAKTRGMMGRIHTCTARPLPGGGWRGGNTGENRSDRVAAH